MNGRQHYNLTLTVLAVAALSYALVLEELIRMLPEGIGVVPLGAQVLDMACHEAFRWKAEKSAHPLTVAVNLSSRQFRQQPLVGTIRGAPMPAG